MSLTSEQQATLKAAILANPTWDAYPNNSDGNFALAQLLNQSASPAFTVWKSYVEASQIMENGFVWTAVDGLTAGKARIWDWLTRYGGFNPSKTNVRQGLVDCFGAGSAMQTAITPHLKRSASSAEKLFATGTGSDASPATMGWEGNLSYDDVGNARNS